MEEIKSFKDRENEFVIDICCIKQIGEDVILVEVNLEKCIRKCKY